MDTETIVLRQFRPFLERRRRFYEQAVQHLEDKLVALENERRSIQASLPGAHQRLMGLDAKEAELKEDIKKNEIQILILDGVINRRFLIPGAAQFRHRERLGTIS